MIYVISDLHGYPHNRFLQLLKEAGFFTRSKKRGDYNRALQRLVFHGASEEILYEAHPHIGSDRLP
ncbi:MAG: hypothetical protein IIX95_07105, partial [Clostridiales bacterium]|nr:hypothetical protein [Clostridiales bacterium]